MRDAEGVATPKVIDLGIAKALHTNLSDEAISKGKHQSTIDLLKPRRTHSSRGVQQLQDKGRLWSFLTTSGTARVRGYQPQRFAIPHLDLPAEQSPGSFKAESIRGFIIH